MGVSHDPILGLPELHFEATRGPRGLPRAAEGPQEIPRGVPGVAEGPQEAPRGPQERPGKLP